MTPVHALLALSLVADAATFTPLASLQVLGGQYFLSEQRGDVSAHISGVLAPAVSFNDRVSLVPSLSTNYRGTKQIVDLVGSGTLFQEQWDNRAGLVGIFKLGDGRFRLKPSGSVTYELMKETADEAWGLGLFDYYKYGGGLETEYVYQEPYSVRVGAEFYAIVFPRYSSLESKAGVDFLGQPLARELAGVKVLDTENTAASLSFDVPLSEDFIVSARLGGTFRHYPGQLIVNEAGQLKNARRNDALTTAGFGLRMPRELSRALRVVGDIDTQLAYNSSNQHSFDAARSQFMRFYYNYGEVKTSPSLRFLIGGSPRPKIVELSGSYWYRRYPYRLVQDSNGLYLSQTLFSHNWTAGFSLNYPLFDRFSALLNFQYARFASNQRFEALYKYNYSSQSYSFGFSFDY